MAVIYIGRTLSSGTDSVRADQGNAGASPWPVLKQNTLVKDPFDYVGLTYDGQNRLQTAVYKQGGSSGTTVATLTLGYTGSLLSSVTKS